MRNVSLIYDYIDVDAINIVKSWFDQLDAKTKAKLNSRLSTLEQMSRTDWKMPMTEVLQGDKDGLIAVRVGHKGIQYRLLGYDGPNRGEFTLLSWCKERNGRYTPLDIGRTAFQRRTDVEKNPSVRRIRHDFR